MANRWRNSGNSGRVYWLQNHSRWWLQPWNLKKLAPWKTSYDQPWFGSVQSLSRVRLFATPWIAAHQASLSITNSWSSLRLTSIESVMPSSHLLLCRPLLLLPPIPPSIRVFSSESALLMRWPEYWSFSFSIIPSKEHPVLISFRMINKFTVQIWLIKLISACLFKETKRKEVWFVFN